MNPVKDVLKQRLEHVRLPHISLSTSACILSANVLLIMHALRDTSSQLLGKMAATILEVKFMNLKTLWVSDLRNLT